jgi:F-type H+-transporting ATPase subunit delta
MKITAKQYAQTLFELTKDKDEIEIQAVISKFLVVLKKRGDFKMKMDIIQQFQRIFNEANGIVEVKIISQQELKQDQLEKIEQLVKNKYQANQVILKNDIQKEILGGIMMQVGDEVMDGSVAGQLKRMRNSLNK